ncbi:MAG: hypothetical protein Tsb0020_27580 [Haliangiales bacterium]
MHSIRDLLDYLVDVDREAIERLCAHRGFKRRGKAAKCESLARSYRGDYEQFFAELRKKDLVELLKSPTTVGDAEYRLTYAGRYSKEDLVWLALCLFRDDDPPSEFTDCSDEDDEDNEDDEDGDGLSALTEVELLGAIPASAARRAPALLDWIAPNTGVSRSTIRRRLRDVHGRTLLRNALDSWPIEVPEGAASVFAALRASAVRRAYTLIEWIARLTSKTFDEVERVVIDADGNTQLKRLFPDLVLVTADDTEPAGEAKTTLKDSSVTGKSDSKRMGQLVRGRWKITRELGRGRFSTVYEARDSRPNGQLVALKVVGRDSQASEFLRNEVALSEKLRHPNICTYRLDDEDPELGMFAVLDHGGQSLDQVIKERGFLNLTEICDVLTKLASALDFAHERNILHQDVKPSNVLVRKTHRRREVRLTDFNISIMGRTGIRTDGGRTVIASGLVGYTPCYAAPEQRRGIPKGASDQYSLALVVCSMLEGRVFSHPYEFRSFDMLSEAQNNALGRALAPDPDDRFESCRAFARDFGVMR